MNAIQIARVVHAANREVQRLAMSEAVPVAPAWEHLPAKTSDALIDAVARQMHDPVYDPRVSHMRWMQDRMADGWVYGPTKREDLKIHPNLQPWEALPEHERAKDELFIAIVGALR